MLVGSGAELGGLWRREGKKRVMVTVVGMKRKQGRPAEVGPGRQRPPGQGRALGAHKSVRPTGGG